ncbi:hypothetical protein CCR75_002237 [Bremia lactucae]|uniref:Protein unc-45 homolog B n=1 Tax=Bremia lactucae TaxID=4779 RepID=A0A976IFU1_BRELC|nr:hypothetical protein CCR75_002237 [Bremia lactucae]
MATTMESLRAEGNQYFSAKEYQSALEKYTEALSAAPSGQTRESLKNVVAQRVLLHSNRAACYLQLENFVAAEKDCTLALADAPDNSKARYRRAQAFMGMGRMTQAFRDVQFVLQHVPTNKAAAALARTIQEHVRQDIHGVQKALDSIVTGVHGEDGNIRLQEILHTQDTTIEALQYLEMKSATEIATLPEEISKRKGLSVLWNAVQQLLPLSTKPAPLNTSILTILSHVVSLLSLLASTSMEFTQKTFETNNGVLWNLLEFSQHHIALEYTENKAKKDISQPLRGQKALIRLAACLFKYLFLQVKTIDTTSLRRVLNGVLDGLRSQERVLQVAAIDGMLHVLSAFSTPTASPRSSDNTLKPHWNRQFTILAQEVGLYSLLHTTITSVLPGFVKAASKESIDSTLTSVILTRVPLVFTQCLAQVEGDDMKLQKLVHDWCISPVLAARPSQRKTLAQASASCLLLSSLFLSNAKLGIHAVQATSNDGTAFLSRLHEFLAASRTFDDCKAHTRQLQEIWVDCVASICGVDQGPACVPRALRMEIYRLLQASLDEADDLILRASALSIQVKLGIVEKTLVFPSTEGDYLVESVLKVLARAETIETKHLKGDQTNDKTQTSCTKKDVNISFYQSTVSPKERGIEALSYLITYTSVKDAFVKSPMAVASVFHVEFPTDINITSCQVFRSNVYYGIGYILHHVWTSEAAIKRTQMEGMDMTADQYEELQKALKQQSVLEDGDTLEHVQARVVQLATSRHVLTTLVHLLKLAARKKSTNLMEMATQSALHAAEVPAIRGKLVQSGVFQALIPLALIHGTHSHVRKKHSLQESRLKLSKGAGQAMAKILISTNPNLLSSSSLFSSIKPLIELCKGEDELMHFEALMALTNIASVSMETKARIVNEPHGLSTLQYLQFSDHELVRRAATEAICNLLPNELVINQVFCNDEKIRLWIAFASLEDETTDFEIARAATGALAMVSQVPQVCWVILRQNGFQAFGAILENRLNVEILHRALVAMQHFLETICSAMKDAEKAEERMKVLAEITLRYASMKQKLSGHCQVAEIKEAAQACMKALDDVIRYIPKRHDQEN